VTGPQGDGPEVTVRRPSTPGEAWAELAAGNTRFVTGHLSHPNQDAARRHMLAGGQRPIAVFFGCADSRVASEIIFDMGLGDLFVIRTAGHVVDTGVLGSLEFGVGVLDIPLIVILGHDSCGAVAATMQAVDTGVLPSGYIRDIVERVTPSVLTAHRKGLTSAEEVESEHVRHTIRLLTERSNLIAERIRSGRLAIVGAAYELDEGRARVVDAVGDVGPLEDDAGRRSS
jgi:carbonic anhydrase